MAGALNVPRSPQGRPLIVQAGSSEDGRGLAARYAEAVFTAQQTLEDAQAFYADLKRRVLQEGRDPRAGSMRTVPPRMPAATVAATGRRYDANLPVDQAQ